MTHGSGTRALFIEEITHSVLDAGGLGERGASGEAVIPVSEETIPATVDASLTSRIDRVGASRATAQLAATIGREFSVKLLHEVSERDRVTLDQDIERLVQAGLVRSAGNRGDTLVFKHALIRDAAYNSLLRSTRQSYHGRIAAVLRDRFTDEVSARPDLVAHHLTNAGEDEDAVTFWKMAGQQAVTQAAVREAAEHYEQAINCLRRLPTTLDRQQRELELQIVLGPLLMSVHGWASVEVERACERALALAEELGRDDRSYPAMWGLWTVRFVRGELAPALEAAERVLQIAQASGVPMIELTGHHATSYTLVFRGEFERALEEADAGLRLFDVEQERLLAHTFSLSSSVALRASRGHALWMLGRVVEAEDAWAAMLQLGRELQHPPSLAAALAFVLHGGSFRYSYIGQLGRLAPLADELLALSREEDFFYMYAGAYFFQGLIAESIGDAERARRQMKEGFVLWRQAGSRLTLVLMNVLCAEALYRMGDDEEAFQRLEAAEVEMKERHEGLLAPDIWRVRGRLLARRGDLSAAEAAYCQAMKRARAQRALSLELRATLDLHDLYAETGRSEEGRAQLDRLLRCFTQGLDRPELARAQAIVGGSSHSPNYSSKG